MTLSIDFDGTVVEASEPLRFRVGALTALRLLKAAGHHLILHSCRCSILDPGPTVDAEVAAFYSEGRVASRITDQWRRLSDMRSFLASADAWDLFDEHWFSPGKPIADLYIDDRSEKPDWAAIAREFGQRVGAA